MSTECYILFLTNKLNSYTGVLNVSMPPVISYETVGPLGTLPAEILQLIFNYLSPIQQFKINVIPSLRAIFNQSKVFDISSKAACKGLKYTDSNFKIMIFLYTYCGMYEDIETQYKELVDKFPSVYSTSICLKYNKDMLTTHDYIAQKINIINDLINDRFRIDCVENLIYDTFCIDCFDLSVFIDIILYKYIDTWTEINDRAYQEIRSSRDADRDYEYGNDSPINRIKKVYIEVSNVIENYRQADLTPNNKAIIDHIFYRHFVRHDHYKHMYIFLFNMLQLYSNISECMHNPYDNYWDKSNIALITIFIKYYIHPIDTVYRHSQMYYNLINHREFIPHLQYIFNHDIYRTYKRKWVKYIEITKDTPSRLIPRLKAIHIALKL